MFIDCFLLSGIYSEGQEVSHFYCHQTLQRKPFSGSKREEGTDFQAFAKLQCETANVMNY